jgi:hypothetical protein
MTQTCKCFARSRSSLLCLRPAGAGEWFMVDKTRRSRLHVRCCSVHFACTLESFSQSFCARNQSENFSLRLDHATRCSAVAHCACEARVEVLRCSSHTRPGGRVDLLAILRLVYALTPRFSFFSSIRFFFLAAINPCHFAFDRKYVHCVVGAEEAEEAKKPTRRRRDDGTEIIRPERPGQKRSQRRPIGRLRARANHPIRSNNYGEAKIHHRPPFDELLTCPSRLRA